MLTADEWSTAPLVAPAGLTGTGSRPGTVVRRKTCSAPVQGTDEAAFTMDLRDFRFRLFTGEGAAMASSTGVARRGTG